MEAVELQSTNPEIQVELKAEEVSLESPIQDDDLKEGSHVNSHVGDEVLSSQVNDNFTDKTGDQQQLTDALQAIVNEAAESSMQTLLTRDRSTSDTTPNTPPTTPQRMTSQSSQLVNNSGGLLDWLNPNGFLSRVAEIANNSVDSMITTLDPGMKEYLYSGGDISLLVASDKDVKVCAVRDAFIDVFGRATVKGVPTSSSITVASQPNSPQAALKSAVERIDFIRTNMAHDIPQNQVIIAIESFLHEITPGSWFESSLVLLDDPITDKIIDGITSSNSQDCSSSGDNSNGLPIVRNNSLMLYSQATPVPTEAINYLKFETSKDYELRDTGFSRTIGEFMSSKLKVSHDQWHEAVIGIPRRSLLYMTSTAIASLYRQRIIFTNRVHNV